MNKKQLIEFIKSVFDVRDPYFKENYRYGINVRKLENNGFDVHLSVAEPIDIKFSDLLKVSKKFGTNKIDLNNSGKQEGCPSCDYGAVYQFTLQVYDVKKNYPKDL